MRQEEERVEAIAAIRRKFKEQVGLVRLRYRPPSNPPGPSATRLTHPRSRSRLTRPLPRVTRQHKNILMSLVTKNREEEKKQEEAARVEEERKRRYALWRAWKELWHPLSRHANPRPDAPYFNLFNAFVCRWKIKAEKLAARRAEGMMQGAGGAGGDGTDAEAEDGGEREPERHGVPLSQLAGSKSCPEPDGSGRTRRPAPSHPQRAASFAVPGAGGPLPLPLPLPLPAGSGIAVVKAARAVSAGDDGGATAARLPPTHRYASNAQNTSVADVSVDVGGGAGDGDKDEDDEKARKVKAHRGPTPPVRSLTHTFR